MFKEINVTKIIPNQLRDFDLNPINSEQVGKLVASAEVVNGQFGSIPVRPLAGDKFEQANGHHLLAALKKLGYKTVKCDVQDWTDQQMLDIMVQENMTQQGAESTGALIDSVAAIVKDAFAKHFEGSEKLTSSELKAAEDGYGVGFRVVLDRAKGNISKHKANQALNILKESGSYAKLMQEISTKFPEAKQIAEETKKVEAEPSLSQKAISNIQGVKNLRSFRQAVKEYNVSPEQQEAAAKAVSEYERGYNSDDIESVFRNNFKRKVAPKKVIKKLRTVTDDDRAVEQLEYIMSCLSEIMTIQEDANKEAMKVAKEMEGYFKKLNRYIEKGAKVNALDSKNNIAAWAQGIRGRMRKVDDQSAKIAENVMKTCDLVEMEDPYGNKKKPSNVVKLTNRS